MPANEFEKQVQKKLEEFQLEPSISVWEKVKEEVRKKKRRRIVFFFILPAALALLGYSIYHYITPGRETELAQQQASVKKENRSGAISKEMTAEKEKINQPLKTSPVDLSTVAAAPQKDNSSIIHQNNLQVSINNPATGHIKERPIGNKENKSQPAGISHNSSSEITSTSADPSKITQSLAEPDKADIAVENGAVENKNSKDNLITDKKNTAPVNKDSSNTSPVTAIDNKPLMAGKKASKSKIKWGIDFSAGFTSNQYRPFSLAKSNDAMAVSMSPGTAAGGPYPTVIPPSSISSGPAFRFEFVGELALSARSRISAGLEYVYASNRIKTGTRVDTSLRVQSTNYLSTQVEQVYRGAQKNNYTNRYQFISIPVGYHWQINKSKKLPLQWDAEASVGYLFATNALVYSSSYGGIYYRDKQAINKVHFGIGTGISIRLAGKKGMEWVFGPELSFDTRKLVNDGYDIKQYLLYGGIHTRLLFPQKKK